MSAKRKLIIDGQIFQTEAKDRGMGRFSAELIGALTKQQRQYQEVTVLLSDQMPHSQKLQDELDSSFKNVKFQICNLWTTKDSTLEAAAAHNQAVLNELLSSLSASIDYFIPALIQEPSVSVFPKSVRKLMLFHDIIPFLYYRRYRPLMNFDNYLKRFRHIFEADLIFTNSQTVADDLHTYLGIPAEKLVRIDGAAIISNKTPVKPNMPLPESFILTKKLKVITFFL